MGLAVLRCEPFRWMAKLAEKHTAEAGNGAAKAAGPGDEAMDRARAEMRQW